MGRVSFIPSQTTDEAAFASDRAALQDPLTLFCSDVSILLRNISFIRNITHPKHVLSSLPGLPERERSLYIRDKVLTIVSTVIELIVLFVTLPLFIYLPGWMSIIYVVCVSATLILLQNPMWGSLVVNSHIPLPVEYLVKFKNERWFFINGIATSHQSLEYSCDRLSATFKHPIIGIHNRSYGIVGDIFECLIQRCLGYYTTDVRCAYDQLKNAILDPSIRKIVVLAHSQGGILISLAMDRMFVELPAEAISKLEVYTFGSAAAHMNNPLKYSSAQQHHSLCSVNRDHSFTSFESVYLPTPHTHVLNTIEHYCNEYDMVPRWGVLYNTQHCPHQRYAGQVFIHQGASGHLFNEHYLDAMFPLRLSNSLDLGEGGLRVTRFMDDVVDVDDRTVLQRMKKVNNIIEKTRRTSVRRTGVQQDMDTAGEDADGKTVRQLSKLWKYIGGGMG